MFNAMVSFWFWGTVLVAPSLLGAEDVQVSPGEGAPGSKTLNTLRPGSITWGGYCHNEQLIGSENQWEFVQQYMDGFVMHGMYWIKKRDNSGLITDEVWLETIRALGRCLQKYGKTAHIETGHGENEVDYQHDDPKKRSAVNQANKDVENLKLFLKEGVKVSKVRDDWFPMAAAAVYAETFKTTSTRDLLAMVTGAEKYWGTVPGFDPARGNWREYVGIIHAAFPDMAFGFDQAPCNFDKVEPDPTLRALVPWEALGYGYSSKGLRTLYRKREVLVGGKPVPVSLDFADLMMSVALSTREAGINFYGFEGDTPYLYVTDNHGRMGKDLLPFLLKIERMQHKYGFHNSKIINDSPKTADSDGFTIDLGQDKIVDRAVIHWGAGFARKYNWEGSCDNQAWTQLVGVEDGQGGVDERKFKPRPIRWIRCVARARGTENGYSISEVELFGPDHPAENLALKKKATAKSVMPKEGHTDVSTYAPKAGPAPQLVDGDPATCWTADYVTNDMWDGYFHDRTLAYLETYQAAGGRADQYIAESWYAGPYALFPETRPGTFSNLAKELIRRLRGINDDGSPMVVDLAMRKKGAENFIGNGLTESAPSASQTITVSSNAGTPVVLEALIRNDGKELNKGDARCLPLIRCPQLGGAQSGVICRDNDGRDITAQVACTGAYDGWFVGGLEPGQVRNFSVEITPSASLTTAALTFELYWNAQDPSLKPRDVFTLKMKERCPAAR